DPPLAAWLPLEMLHGVRTVDRPRFDAGRLEAPVEQPPGGADERVALAVLLVARLLADQHEGSVSRPFAEDGLGGIAPELAAAARLHRLAHAAKTPALGHVALRTLGTDGRHRACPSRGARPRTGRAPSPGPLQRRRRWALRPPT